MGYNDFTVMMGLLCIYIIPMLFVSLSLPPKISFKIPKFLICKKQATCLDQQVFINLPFVVLCLILCGNLFITSCCYQHLEQNETFMKNLDLTGTIHASSTLFAHHGHISNPLLNMCDKQISKPMPWGHAFSPSLITPPSMCLDSCGWCLRKSSLHLKEVLSLHSLPQSAFW